MERTELHSKLEEKLTECWNSYQLKFLALPPSQIIEKAAEIAATRFCCDELTENAVLYPEDLLEHLMQFDDPLEVMREQWMDEQNVDFSDEFEHALWNLRECGPKPENSPAMGGMTME